MGTKSTAGDALAHTRKLREELQELVQHSQELLAASTRLVASSRRQGAEFRDAITAPRGSLLRFLHSPSQLRRPRPPCANLFAISIVNTPVARCRAKAQADRTAHRKVCFTATH